MVTFSKWSRWGLIKQNSHWPHNSQMNQAERLIGWLHRENAGLTRRTWQSRDPPYSRLPFGKDHHFLVNAGSPVSNPETGWLLWWCSSDLYVVFYLILIPFYCLLSPWSVSLYSASLSELRLLLLFLCFLCDGLFTENISLHLKTFLFSLIRWIGDIEKNKNKNGKGLLCLHLVSANATWKSCSPTRGPPVP